MVSVVKVTEWDVVALADLRSESVAEGYQFIARLCDEWRSGANRFDAPGEGLFVAQHSSGLVGVCGLNRDPYVDDPSIGRVRHLYVNPSHRRQGVGRSLVTTLIEAAAVRFRILRLRTTPGAESFYQALGFQCPIAGHEPIYVLHLGSVRCEEA